MTSLEGRGRRRSNLKLDPIVDEDSKYISYRVEEGVFVKENIAIGHEGIAMQDEKRAFRVNPDELEICDVIGTGCSSTVRKAIHIPSGGTLALKFINCFDKEKRKQLIKEILSLYNCDCAALIKFFGAYYDEGTITIALEFMNLGSLNSVAKMLPHPSIPEKALANITFQLLWGLSYLKHDKRVHRDIKPGNILINTEGEVKLSDFGIATELTDSVQKCRTFIGTCSYMSPERLQSVPYSFKSDIWSLGIVVCELATGFYPFERGANFIENLQIILEGKMLPMKGCSADLCEFVQHCTHRTPEERVHAEVLLGSPWLVANGATSLEIAVANTKAWIVEAGLSGDSF